MMRLQRKDVLKLTKKRKIKRCTYKSKREVNEQFGNEINHEINGNKKLFREDVSKADGGKVERYNKGWKSEVALVEDEAQRIYKDYFWDHFRVDTQEQVAFHMCRFDSVQRGNYFGGEPFR